LNPEHLQFRKLFPKDVSSSTVQRDLSKFARVGVIDAVDPQEGTCTVRWMDRPGIRLDVIITQGSPGGFTIPKVGTIVIVVFDAADRALIASYLTIGHAERVKKLNTLPKFAEDENFWEVGGSYIYMRQNGDILLSTLREGYLLLENATGTLKSETVNWKVITEGGINYFGLVKRLVDDIENPGNKHIETIKDNIGINSLVEYRLKILESADGTLGIDGNTEPILEMVLGNVVDDDGVIIAKDDNVAVSPEKQLCARIKLKSGIQIDIDKEGRVSMKNIKVNINEGSTDIGDPDIALGLETNDSAKGKKGQHSAREHDKITLPIAITRTTEADHLGLITKNSSNLVALQTLATSFMSPMGPCFLNPAVLTDGLELTGEITEGAADVVVGDGSLEGEG